MQLLPETLIIAVDIVCISSSMVSMLTIIPSSPDPSDIIPKETKMYTQCKIQTRRKNFTPRVQNECIIIVLKNFYPQ